MKLRRPEVGGKFGPKQAQVGVVRLIARCGQNREREREREREERSLMAGPWSARRGGPLDGNITSFRSWFVKRERERGGSDCKNHRRLRRRLRLRRRRRLVWVAVHNHGSFTFGEKRERRRERVGEGRAKYETPLLSRHAAPLA